MSVRGSTKNRPQCDCERPNEATDADGVRYCFDCGHRLRPRASPMLVELADLVVDGVAERVATLVADCSAEGWISVQQAAQHLACKPQRVTTWSIARSRTAFRSSARVAGCSSAGRSSTSGWSGRTRPSGLRRVSDRFEPGCARPLTRVEWMSMATNHDTLPRLLTVDEVSNLLHYSRSSVYRLINKGDLPAVRLGAGPALRVRADALEDWLTPASSEERRPTA